MKFKNSTDKTRTRIVLACILFLAATSSFASCGNVPNTVMPPSSTEAAQSQNEIAGTSPIFAYWQKQFPNAVWDSLAKADLNNDGRDDLVIVYNQGKDTAFFVVIEDLTTGYRITDPTPAPIQDQVIKIMDLSGWAQHQFAISGRKDDVVGMAIFVMDNHKIVMIYTSAYGDCC